MGFGTYILGDNEEPVLCSDTITAFQWMRDNPAAKFVGRTNITDAVHVSTVFLGMDHAFRPGPPVLWETMIFGGEHDQAQWRYTSAHDARRHHTHVVRCLLMHKDPAYVFTDEDVLTGVIAVPVGQSGRKIAL